MRSWCEKALRVDPKPMRFLGGPRNDMDWFRTGLGQARKDIDGYASSARSTSWRMRIW